LSGWLPTTDITDLSDANNNGRQLWDLKHADPADFAKAVGWRGSYRLALTAKVRKFTRSAVPTM
jgi:hypothetical protein